MSREWVFQLRENQSNLLLMSTIEDAFCEEFCYGLQRLWDLFGFANTCCAATFSVQVDCSPVARNSVNIETASLALAMLVACNCMQSIKLDDNLCKIVFTGMLAAWLEQAFPGKPVMNYIRQS